MSDSAAWLPLGLLSWTAFMLYRGRYSDPSLSNDLLLSTFAGAWTIYRTERHDFNESSLLYVISILSGISWCTIYLAGFFSIRKKVTAPQQASKNNVLPWISPSIIPSRTTHIRLFLKKHSFSYSYLLVGIPVGWKGRVSRWVSVDSSDATFFKVRAADYLQRYNQGLGLREKLDKYLETQQVDPCIYPYVYLVTAPRVLGYSFNPVSFWYLYDVDYRLKSMILEVNNTFDERRMYLLQVEDGKTSKEGIHFTQVWNKDFHVSPFNDREGSYSLIAQDPLSNSRQSVHMISNTITLMSVDQKPKLVARIFSTEAPINASEVSIATALHLMASYSWVGFITFARILREAAKLYFKKGLQVFFRPEVELTSISRKETAIEMELEKYFSQYLKYACESYTSPINVTYKFTNKNGWEKRSRLASSSKTAFQEVELRVLTPVFFSRLMGYHSMAGAILEECRNKTIVVTNAESLSRMLAQHGRSAPDRRVPGGVSGLRWSFLSRIRRRPADTVNAETSVQSDNVSEVVDPRDPSDLDRFFMESHEDGWLYRRQVTAALLAQRITSDIVPLLYALDLGFRLMLLLVSAQKCTWSIRIGHPDSLFWASVIKVALINQANVWAWIKGVGG